MTMSYFFFFQAEDGIRDLVRSRGLGDVYKRQPFELKKLFISSEFADDNCGANLPLSMLLKLFFAWINICLLYTSDAADERSSVDLGGRRIIKKKKNNKKYVIF